MARPPKPPMTDLEFGLACEVLSRPFRAKGSSLGAAALAISRSRGADRAIDPQTRKDREVSARWVGRQIKARGFMGKTHLRAKLNNPHYQPANGRNPPALCETGSPLSKPTNPEALGAVADDSLRPQLAQGTGPGGNQEDASAKGAAK